jgi:hypothetical protein
MSRQSHKSIRLRKKQSESSLFDKKGDDLLIANDGIDNIKNERKNTSL